MADVGRPPIYSDSQDVQNAIDAYFIKCEDPDKPEKATITGLALHLGFCSKGTLYEYAKKPEFSDSIKRALLKVEHEYEKMLPVVRGGGVIFALNNMGWENKQHVDHTSGGEKLQMPPPVYRVEIMRDGE